MIREYRLEIEKVINQYLSNKLEVFNESFKSIKNALEEALNLKKENLIDMGIESKKLANNLFSSKKILENWEKIFHDGKY